MENNLSQLWSNCMNVIESQLSKATINTWFKQVTILKEEEGIIFIAVPNEFVRDWLVQKHNKLILKAIVDHANHIRAIEFVITQLPSSPSTGPLMEAIANQENILPSQNVYINRDDNLNPRYIFEHFIVGPFNELAYAAAQSVVKRPQNTYNPLFVYGSSGLGKTHLIQAIGNEIKRLYPEKRVLYTSLEKFMNEYVSSVQNNRQQAFQDKYNKFDVLIIDDIQFISGKEGTQHALFHIFNNLHDQGKNIILSSDKHPNHIIGLEDRLKTRFNSGMTIDIQEPDLESRLAIIKDKSSQLQYPLEPDVLSYIASAVIGSIRELEGVINLINMHSTMRQRPISLADVKSLVKNNIKPKKLISIDSVVKIVSEYYNLDEGVIYEKTRRKEIVRARQIIMFVLREDFNESYPSIGAKLGGKDHTTVIHSYEKIKGELSHDAHLMKELDDIRILFK
ncbi:MAG TPA: chromosomal replication initiator protein DnaA [Candidatus Paceibacterota bacterium]|jgi:chromosomal replication initiator protein|nr:chromosomal replication initiator protein DnaA [Candidatus Paceibacterota bacterium]